MDYYLTQVSYTPEAWNRMVKNPQNRFESVKSVVEKLGGSLEGFWLVFGEYDVVAIIQMPGRVSAAALSMAAIAGGGVKSFKTTPMLTVDEGLKAMKSAGKSDYIPPCI
jgi:uncharacterized protein with GYD domain